jgi:hypothetical protein
MDAGTKPDAGVAESSHDGSPAGPDSADLLGSEIARVAEAYRRMPHSKFTLQLEPWGSRAQAGYWLAEQFARLAQRIEAWPEPAPDRRPLPRLGDFALGDQIAVTGRELIEAYRELKDPAGTLLQVSDTLIPVEKAMAVVLESTTAMRKAI